MFYSEALLAKEGPLAEVWLAANLEKKLSKHQFLQNDIVQSTRAIASATIQNDDSEALALRLSGQLLYGVVRIYSRKAKYLLDDVSDALLKLKSAIRSSASTITLPPTSTIILSMNQLVLQDTVTTSDLLFQEPLTFDEDGSVPTHAGIFGAAHAAVNKSFDEDFDESIEIARSRIDELDELPIGGNDLDIDLNFDIDDDRVEGGDGAGIGDQSIETGRADDNANLSALDVGYYDDIDLSLGGGDGYFSSSLETLGGAGEGRTQEPMTPPKRSRKPRSTLMAGHRKIVTDDKIEIPISDFSSTEGIVEEHTKVLELDLTSKRAFIDSLLNENYIRDDIAQKLLNVKRQKTSLPEDDVVPDLVHSENENGLSQDGGDEEDLGFDQSMDLSFDFDVDQERIDSDGAPSFAEHASSDAGAEFSILEDQDSNAFTSTPKDNQISESTIKVASELRTFFETESKTTLSNIVDIDHETGQPLSHYPKSEATRVFFELLVLGTADTIGLKQSEPFGEIEIEPRETLFQKFM